MLFINGHIEFARNSGGGIDSGTGYPAPVMTEWEDDIPCQFRAPKMDLKAKSADGSSFIDVSYEILIEWQVIPSERIRLCSFDGNLIGEYQVIRVMPLREVSKVKIWV